MAILSCYGRRSRYTASAVSMAIICNHNGNTLLALGDSNFLALLAFAAIL